MNPVALSLALILTGIVCMALGIVNVYYNKVVFRKYEEYDAVITKLKSIKGKSWNPNEALVPYAEYTVNGVLINGAYYTPITSTIVDFRVNDSVIVQVNPDNPKAFRIADIENTTEMENTRKRSPLITAIGAVIMIVGFIIMFTA